MANAIELQLILNDQMTAGLLKSSAAVAGFSQQLKAFALASAGAATATIGLVTAGVSHLRSVAGQVEQLNNLSEATGVSARNLQVLQFAFKQGGVSSDALATGLNFMTRSMQSNSSELSKVGVTSRDTFTAFMQLSKWASQTGDTFLRNKTLSEAFGRGAGQLVPILNQLANSYGNVSDAAQKTGNIFNDDELKRMQKVDDAFDRLSARVEGFGKRLALMVAGPGWAAFKLVFQGKALDPTAGFTRTGGIGDAVVSGIDVVAERMKRVDFGGFGSDTSSGLGQRTIDIAKKLRISDFAQETKLQLTEAGKAFERFAEQVAHSFDIIGQHVYSGFFAVLSQLTSKTQTFASAMKTLWRSIVDGILAAMADLIASAITKAFLKILGAALLSLTGNAGFLFGAGTATTELFGNAVSPGSIPGAGTASLGGGGNTFVIQTFDAKSTLGTLINPTGSFRNANDRLFEIGSVR